MNFKQLSERLEDAASWSINAVGIRRIESGERRVTPDDLMALAVALDVSPITLLLPNSFEGDEPVDVTGVPDPCTAEALWKWLRAERPFTGVADGVELLKFVERAWPAWRSREYAEGVRQLLELKQIEDDMASENQQVAAAARRRLQEIQAQHDGND